MFVSIFDLILLQMNEIGEKRKRDLLVDSLKLSFFKCYIPSRKNS